MAFSGLKGQTGPQGADGYSPAVTVTNIPGGHRVNITDATHPSGQNFDVMNGDGAGDMLAQDYDSTSAVANAGGIPAYVSANAMQTNGSNAASEVKFDGSFTVGLRAFNSTVGTVSVSEGSLNTASGSYSHAEGSNTTASDSEAHAEGSGTTASGMAAHAEGWNTVASGNAAHAEGYYNTTASGQYSHAEGWSTTASGSASHTEGNHTTANQLNAHAEGSYTTASNDSAHAEGRGSTASGQYSHAGGYYTTAGYSYQTAIGYYNSNKSANVFEVGNGIDLDNKSNAFEVRKNGDINVQGQILRNGAPEYLEDDNVTLSTSTTTTVTFTFFARGAYVAVPAAFTWIFIVYLPFLRPFFAVIVPFFLLTVNFFAYFLLVTLTFLYVTVPLLADRLIAFLRDIATFFFFRVLALSGTFLPDTFIVFLMSFATTSSLVSPQPLHV